MATAESKIVRLPRPTNEEAEHRKAEFDSCLPLIRFHVKTSIKHTDRDAGSYYYRQLVELTQLLEQRFGFGR